MINEFLQKCNLKTEDDYYNSLREIFQEIALVGLYRTNFFERAAFYGGTCLRIFHGLRRYSEDLDFSLLKIDKNFSLDFYFESLKTEFRAFGVGIEIKPKQKKNNTAIESAFLKSNTIVHILSSVDNSFSVPFNKNRTIKIKFEVDTVPPLGFSTDEKLLLRPFSCFIKCFSLPDLFAGKVHALLFRKWKNRVKGRDWYDFEWYVKNNIELNLSHLTERAVQSKDINEEICFTENLLYSAILERIDTLDFDMVKDEVRRFVGGSEAVGYLEQRLFYTTCKVNKV